MPLLRYFVDVDLQTYKCWAATDLVSNIAVRYQAGGVSTPARGKCALEELTATGSLRYDQRVFSPHSRPPHAFPIQLTTVPSSRYPTSSPLREHLEIVDFLNEDEGTQHGFGIALAQIVDDGKDIMILKYHGGIGARKATIPLRDERSSKAVEAYVRGCLVFPTIQRTLCATGIGTLPAVRLHSFVSGR